MADSCQTVFHIRFSFNLIQLNKFNSIFHQQMPDDAVMLRFLRARDCNLEKVCFGIIFVNCKEALVGDA